MNKLFRLIGFVLFFLILLLIVLGINSPSEIQVSQTHQLQAPISLIWQYVIDTDKNPEWIKQFPIQYCENDSNDNIICYSDNTKKYIVFTIYKIEEYKSLQLVLNKDRYNPYINYYSMNIYMKTLRDGTTEINCELKYNLSSLLAKVVNKLYFEGHQKSLMEQNFDFLHKHFEKV